MTLLKVSKIENIAKIMAVYIGVVYMPFRYKKE